MEVMQRQVVLKPRNLKTQKPEKDGESKTLNDFLLRKKKGKEKETKQKSLNFVLCCN